MIVRAFITDSTIEAKAAMEPVIPVTAEIWTQIRLKQACDDYEGPYEVTSFTAAPLLTTSLVLPTNDMHMLDDVTVYSVPTSEEYNAAGGVTFTIGG